MSKFDFQFGTRFLINDNEYEVIKIRGKELDIKNLRYNKIETWEKSELLSLWLENKLIFRIRTDEKDNNEIKESFNNLTIDEKKEAKYRYSIIEPIIKGDIRTKEINKYLEGLGNPISRATFFNWKKKWEETHDIRSLVSNKTGPKGPSSSEEVIKLIETIINENSYHGVSVTDTQLYLEFLLRVREINEYRVQKPIKAISESTFRRHKKKLVDEHKINKIKHGKANADLMKTGSSKEVVVQRPLQRVEIDWTPVDVLLINPETLKPARPTLVYAVDKYSGHPLGFYVTFNSIDANAVKQCILHSIMPKTYIKDMYPLVKNEWSAYGCPKLIALDNARINESHNIEDTCLQLNIEILYCKVGAGNQKGTVERAFRTLNTTFIHNLRGTTFSNIIEKGYYDSVGNACISMQAFIYMAHIAMVDMISNSYNTRLGCTPKEAWDEGMKKFPHLELPLPHSIDELKMIFSSGFTKRSITNKGITIQNEYYTSDELMELKSKLEKEAQKSNGNKVNVRFDQSDMRNVFVYDKFKRSYIKAGGTGFLRKGFDTNYPIHYSILELDSNKKNDKKRQIDKTEKAVASRKIKDLEEIERKKYTKAKKEKDSVKSAYEGISSKLISEYELRKPEDSETIVLISEEVSDKNTDNVDLRKKKKQNNQNEVDKKEETNLSYDIDIDSLQTWESNVRK